MVSKPWSVGMPYRSFSNIVYCWALFDKSRPPLATWLEAAWHVLAAKDVMSAKTLGRTIGTSYQIAWMILQCFRVAMVNSERMQLLGTIEVDETLLGGVQQGGKRACGAMKSIIAVTIEMKQS